MSKGGLLFAAIVIGGVFAEILDHSTIPMVVTIANITEFLLFVAAAWKITELVGSRK